MCRSIQLPKTLQNPLNTNYFTTTIKLLTNQKNLLLVAIIQKICIIVRMALPKRKHSKSRTRQKRNAHYTRDETAVVKTADGKGFKRPHVEEYKEL
jgi:ribosomal protein L32